MYQATLGNRSFFIDDEEIRTRVGNDLLSFKVVKDVSGDVVVVAMRDNNKGVRVFNGRRMRVNAPAILKKRAGLNVTVYIERLRPLSGEVFRVRPVDFKFDEIKSRDVITKPYMTDTELVIPQMYLNEHLTGGYYRGISVSFSNTTRDTIRDGYILVRLKDTGKGKAYVDEYRLRECGSGLRTTKLVSTLDFLGRNKKKLSNYIYKGTLEGVMYFREIKV